ncbi:MAG: hypothetical protein EAZ42_07970 [Verrucomicrobia bacterium]|nr:MAG: hypothetical protein EAZ42_07970 [Verrucomicrobiota bacterium]
MKEIFKLTSASSLLAALFFNIGSSTSAWAQESAEKPAGFIRFVNAVVEGDGPLEISINGERTNQKGYKLGQRTRAFEVPTGTQEITIVRNGTESGKTRVKVEDKLTTTLIPFAERMPATDEKPAFWAIRILRLKQITPKTEFAASFISVANNPEIQVELGETDGSWKPYSVKRMAVTSAPISFTAGYVPLRLKGGDELPSIPISNAGNYVVLFYNDHEDKLQSISFQDAKLLSAD